MPRGGAEAGFAWWGPHDRARRSAEVLLAGVATVCAAYVLTVVCAVVLTARIVRLGSDETSGWQLHLAAGTFAVLTVVSLGGLATFIATIASQRLATRSARMSNARPPEGSEAASAQREVDEFALALGFRAPAVRVVEDPAPNGFAAGHSRACFVVLTTGALELPADQRKALCAQTMTSVANRALPLTCAAGDLVGVVRRFTRVVWCLMGVVLVSTIFGVDPLLAAALTASIALLVVVTMPLLALAEHAIPRLRSRAASLADLDAVALTDQPAALARLLLATAKNRRTVAGAWAVAPLWFDLDVSAPSIDPETAETEPERARRARQELIERARVLVDLADGDPTLRAELARAEQG